jgi:hypothetical protein
VRGHVWKQLPKPYLPDVSVPWCVKLFFRSFVILIQIAPLDKDELIASHETKPKCPQVRRKISVRTRSHHIPRPVEKGASP